MLTVGGFQIFAVPWCCKERSLRSTPGLFVEGVPSTPSPNAAPPWGYAGCSAPQGDIATSQHRNIAATSQHLMHQLGAKIPLLRLSNKVLGLIENFQFFVALLVATLNIAPFVPACLQQAVA